MDNLSTQKKNGFIGKIHAANGSAVFGPPNKTEGWQPIDAGHLGATLKELARHCFHNFLDKPLPGGLEQFGDNEIRTNFDKWTATAGGFSASQKRTFSNVLRSSLSEILNTVEFRFQNQHQGSKSKHQDFKML